MDARRTPQRVLAMLGLAAVDLMAQDARRAAEQLAPGVESRAELVELARYAPARGEIESFWLRPEHRRSGPWLDHEDINDVMLATSLAPEGFLMLRPPVPAPGP